MEKMSGRKIGKNFVFEVYSKTDPSYETLLFEIRASDGRLVARINGYRHGAVFAVGKFFLDESLPKSKKPWLAEKIYGLAENYVRGRGVKLWKSYTHEALARILEKRRRFVRVSESPTRVQLEKKLGPKKPVAVKRPRHGRR